MEYTKYAYLWPPRPSECVPADTMGFYRRKGWVAQAKKNGTCNIITVFPDRTVRAMNRHEQEHKQWQFSENSARWFRALPGNGWWVFVAELLHSKTKSIKDINYVFDVLVADGELLEGKTFAERQEILQNLMLMGNEAETDTHWIVDPNVWLAKCFDKGFKTFFQKISEAAKASDDAPSNEGLVLKNPHAPLALPFKQTANSGWQVKCRVPHKNFGF